MRIINYKIKFIYLIAFLILTPIYGIAQKVDYKPNWQNLDLANDSVFGISTEKAYQELLKNKKSTTVIVAVIDGGVDIQHEDLKSVIYKNPKEKLNGKDDDKNGYADDLYGWNFLGSGNKNIEFETLELVRQINKLNRKFINTNVDSLYGKDKEDYNLLITMETDLNKKLKEANSNLAGIGGFKYVLDKMESKIGIDNLNYEGFEAFKPTEQGEAQIKKVLLNVLKDNTIDYASFKKEQIDDAYKYYNEKVNYHLNLNYNPRLAIGLNDENKFYGNTDVTGPDASHGSHVAGIIAANRDNNLGIKGVANNVKILTVRTVPNGDERDTDVAYSIIYAVDNGAKIINMSFGKGYSDNKKIVDDAVKYALSKDVLLIHAAGNENANLDVSKNYPNKFYADSTGFADAWIEIGASGAIKDETLKADFSNYGKTTVDVFAPGVAINSTTPNSNYKEESGTSMAAPVVSGLATLIRSYYPKFTALQVKQIILDSSIKVNQKIKLMVNNKSVKMMFSDLSVSGGIVNTFEALKMAESMSKSLSANN
ncbi:S8 family serine peptidase [Pedobacter alpinus]|uniref:S8 family serine peptidase n=1 Tax=Pedobacter alpinus TaxID=1590643 RepID=A0ABW5TSN9_9SPHI